MLLRLVDGGGGRIKRGEADFGSARGEKKARLCDRNSRVALQYLLHVHCKKERKRKREERNQMKARETAHTHTPEEVGEKNFSSSSVEEEKEDPQFLCSVPQSNT